MICATCKHFTGEGCQSTIDAEGNCYEPVLTPREERIVNANVNDLRQRRIRENAKLERKAAEMDFSMGLY